MTHTYHIRGTRQRSSALRLSPPQKRLSLGWTIVACAALVMVILVTMTTMLLGRGQLMPKQQPGWEINNTLDMHMADPFARSA